MKCKMTVEIRIHGDTHGKYYSQPNVEIPIVFGGEHVSGPQPSAAEVAARVAEYAGAAVENYAKVHAIATD